ncbi:hypothetical protein B296_00001166 [Ensete ventricosum]|uniref:Uncharacterized protein n=1 Tax=Ensete ventricosum TaxID=4639 RepID=A0A426YWR6_ENSVE|nr:hypothetical protein B296_00001166 [Ensete ventricosum]
MKKLPTCTEETPQSLERKAEDAVPGRGVTALAEVLMENFYCLATRRSSARVPSADGRCRDQPELLIEQSEGENFVLRG